MTLRSADVVKAYRAEVGLSQTQLSAVLRIAQSKLSDIENGGSISKRIAKKLAVLTEQPLEIFIE